MKGDDDPLVYVVVLNYNGLHLNTRCLRSLFRQEYENMRVLFVDNGSTDGSLQAVRDAFGAAAEYLENGENLYFAAGNNRGIQYALEGGANFVFLVNNDTELAPACISRLVAFMRARPDVGACQPLLLRMPADPRDRPFDFDAPGHDVASAGTLVSLSGRCWDDGTGKTAAAFGNAPREVGGITGGAMFLAARALREVKGFDPAYVMYFEDVDLCFRLRKAGYRLYLVPDARMTHAVGATISRHVPLLRIRLCEANSYRLVWSHFPARLRRKALVAGLCFSVGSFCARLLRGQGGAAMAVARGALQGLRSAAKTPSFAHGEDPNAGLEGDIRTGTWFPPRP